MIKIKTILFLFVFILVKTIVFAQDGFPYRKGKVKHRISAGAVISFYKNHPFHTVNTKRKMGANVAYKAEILLGRKTNLLIGLEYLSQGLTFNGYYKAPNATYLFDNTFAYTHELRYNEIQLPIGFKLAFNNEKDSPVSAYMYGGVGARYIFNSYIVITNDSTNVSPYDGTGTIGFENEIALKGFNAFFYGGLGVQKNFRDTGKALFFELTYRYGISRIRYDGYQNSNNLNIKEANLAITIGFRF